jgi:hypothetical protein
MASALALPSPTSFARAGTRPRSRHHTAGAALVPSHAVVKPRVALPTLMLRLLLFGPQVHRPLGPDAVEEPTFLPLQGVDAPAVLRRATSFL